MHYAYLGDMLLTLQKMRETWAILDFYYFSHTFTILSSPQEFFKKHFLLGQRALSLFIPNAYIYLSLMHVQLEPWLRRRKWPRPRSADHSSSSRFAAALKFSSGLSAPNFWTELRKGKKDPLWNRYGLRIIFRDYEWIIWTEKFNLLYNWKSLT